MDGVLKRSWTTGRSIRRGMSQRTYSTTARRTTKVIKLGGGGGGGGGGASVNLWSKLKHGYMNIMLHLGGKDDNTKRNPKLRQGQHKMSNTEFDNRLIQEIYKSVSASMELNTST